jgi:hypothetical protein
MTRPREGKWHYAIARSVLGRTSALLGHRTGLQLMGVGLPDRRQRSRVRPALSSLDKRITNDTLMYQYKWIPGGLAPSDLVESMTDLYSTQYGIWGSQGPHPGKHVKSRPRGSERIGFRGITPVSSGRPHLEN